MSDDIEQLVEEIVTEIAMSTNNKPWLILEGANDEKFFLSRLPSSIRLLVVFGWENVVEVVNKVKDENIRGILGIIDRDYREALGIEVFNDNIVVTDDRDIEVMMFYSSAFRRVMVEKASQKKLPKCSNGEIDYEKMREGITDIAVLLGKFRFYCQKEMLKVKIPDDLDFSSFIDYKQSMDFTSPNSFIKHLKDKSQNKNQHLKNNDWDQAQKLSLPICLKNKRFIVSGHDLMELFGLSLRRKWGNKNKNEVTREKVEEWFRLSYPDEEFRKTSLYQKISDWLHAL